MDVGTVAQQASATASFVTVAGAVVTGLGTLVITVLGWSINRNIKSADGKLDGLDTKMDALDSKVGEHAIQLAQGKEQITQLQKDRDEFKAKIERIERYGCAKGCPVDR